MAAGHTLLRYGMFHDACAAYEGAVMALPTWWIARYERARCGRLVGDAPHVLLHHAQEALRYDPANAMVYELMGQLLEDTGDPAAASAAYERALQLNPHLEGPTLRLGFTYLALDRPAEAHAHLTRAAAKLPRDLRILSGLAAACGALGDHAGAERALLDWAYASLVPTRPLARLAALYSASGLAGAERWARDAWRRAATGEGLPPRPPCQFTPRPSAPRPASGRVPPCPLPRDDLNDL